MGIAAALLILQVAPAPAISPQTLTDPVDDNCREYPEIGNRCGPDITQAVFSTPGDGNLHVDVTYASLPVSGVPQTVEFVELGIYPRSATIPNLFAVPGIFRVSKLFLPGWKMQSVSANFEAVADVTVTTRELGIDLAVPLAVLGDPARFRYAVNAGSAGETIPQLPDLAPNTGLFELVGDPPEAPVAITPATTTRRGISTPAPAFRSLAGIATRQRGRVLSGRLEVTVGGDLTIEALVPASRLAATSKRRRIARLVKRGVKAGEVSFRLPLRARERRRLAGRRTQVTLRLTLDPASGRTIRRTRKVRLTVPG